MSQGRILWIVTEILPTKEVHQKIVMTVEVIVVTDEIEIVMTVEVIVIVTQREECKMK